jgi:hypothetical protein
VLCSGQCSDNIVQADAGEGAEFVDGEELVGAFAEVEADFAVEPGGGPVALTHDALDFFGCYDKRSFYHSLFFIFYRFGLGRRYCMYALSIL